MSDVIDVADHLGLIHHIIGSLNVPTYLRDEAYSEGLVLLAVAAVNYDPDRGAPVGAYIAQRLRWGLMSWMRREIRQLTTELTDTHTMSHEQEIESRRMLDHIIYIAARRLNAPEYVALLGAVYGVRQGELAHVLGKNAIQLEALRLSAREKLRHELRLV